MKVLFITHCVGMGGGNFSLLQLMKELSQAPYNIEPVLLAPLDSASNTSSILKEAKLLGIKCIEARFYQFKWGSKSILNYIRYLSNIINYWIILRKIKKENIDLIHSNSSVISIGGFLSSRLKIKHIWHLREFGDWDFKLKPLFGKWQETRTYRNADRFIAISKMVKNRFIPFIQPENKISVIYNGLPLSGNENLVLPTKDNEIIKFCISGALNKAKRQEDALEALDILVNNRNLKNVKLFILGEGSDREKLENYCRVKGLSKYVTFTGWIKDVDSYYSQSHVGLMLSTNEAFGRVTIDYMHAGMAIIASNGGANPEIVADKETGILFSTGDIEALSKVMELLVKNKNLRIKLSRNAYLFSQTHFRSEDNTKAIFDIYTDVML